MVKRREQLREKHKGPTYVTKTSIWYNHSYALVHHTPSHRVPCACPPTLAAGGIAVSQSCPSPLPDKGFAPEWSPQDWMHTSPSAPTGGLLCCLACYCAVCAHVQTYVHIPSTSGGRHVVVWYKPDPPPSGGGSGFIHTTFAGIQCLGFTGQTNPMAECVYIHCIYNTHE